MDYDIKQQDDFSVALSQPQMPADLDTSLLIQAVNLIGDNPATIELAAVFRHKIGKMLSIRRTKTPLQLFHDSMAAT